MIAANDRLSHAVRAVRAHAGFDPTSYQESIFDFCINGEGNGIVNAVPGSGKSTSLELTVVGVNAVNDPRKQPPILVGAFGKAIAGEMKARLPYDNCTVKTLNGLGAGVLRNSHFGGASLDEDKTVLIFKSIVRYDQLGSKEEMVANQMVGPIKRLVALFKNYGFGAIRPLPTNEEIYELCDKFDVDLPDEEDVDRDQFFELLLETFEKGNKNNKLVDYDDQLYLPILHGMAFPRYYKYILIDEGQDTNPIQLEMIGKMIGQNTRALFAGDEYQAIFGFRGADVDAMEKIRNRFKTTNLDLSICFRCPRVVVEWAKQINPAIEAAPNAIEGVMRDVKEDTFIQEVEDGDMVVCRVSAPLVGHCLDLIREGKKAYVKGLDMAKGLEVVIGKIARKKKLTGDPSRRIEAYRIEQTEKISDPGKLARINDKLMTVAVLAEGCDTFDEVRSNIRRIFAEDKAGICCSTVHKAKGLEADHVWILNPELMPHPSAKKEWEQKQETNLLYVAGTRAKVSCNWVISDKKRKVKR